MEQFLKTRFVEKKQLATDTWLFIFKKPTGFFYQAGQYTTLFLGEENRDFTICAYPQNEKFFSIVTKKGISNFKKKLFLLRNNSLVSFKKPSGGFILHENGSPKVFLAGGIGITVFYTIIQYVIKNNIKIPITLFVSFSKRPDIIFYNELQKIQQENENIKVIYTLSQEDWEGEEGRISEQLIKKYVACLQKSECMVAGGEQMVYDSEEMLLQMGIPQENIRIDIFTGY